MKKTYTNLKTDRKDQNFTAIIPITLGLVFEQKEEKAWVIKKIYGKISLTVENPQNIPIGEIQLLRKVNDGNFEVLKGFDPSDISANTIVYLDKFLHKNNSYQYKMVVTDTQGNILKQFPDDPVSHNP